MYKPGETGADQIMSEHKYIWLQPECCADPDEGRHWCKDPDPVGCDDGVPWTKYILHSEHESTLSAVQAELEQSQTVAATRQSVILGLNNKFNEHVEKIKRLEQRICNQRMAIDGLSGELERAREQCDKFKWQVRNTYQRAIKAENPDFMNAMRMARNSIESGKPKQDYTIEDYEVLLAGLDILLKGAQPQVVGDE